MKTNLFICGSNKVEDENFVRFMLDATYTSLKMLETNMGIKFDSVHVGDYAGTDKIVRSWAESKGLKVVNFSLKQNEISHSVLSSDIPDLVFKKDKRFQSGIEEFKNKEITIGLVIPNPSGALGVTTKNIKKMLGFANISVQDGADFLKTYKSINQLDVITTNDVKKLNKLKP